MGGCWGPPSESTHAELRQKNEPRASCATPRLPPAGRARLASSVAWPALPGRCVPVSAGPPLGAHPPPRRPSIVSGPRQRRRLRSSPHPTPCTCALPPSGRVMACSSTRPCPTRQPSQRRLAGGPPAVTATARRAPAPRTPRPRRHHPRAVGRGTAWLLHSAPPRVRRRLWHPCEQQSLCSSRRRQLFQCLLSPHLLHPALALRRRQPAVLRATAAVAAAAVMTRAVTAIQV